MPPGGEGGRGGFGPVLALGRCLPTASFGSFLATCVPVARRSAGSVQASPLRFAQLKCPADATALPPLNRCASACASSARVSPLTRGDTTSRPAPAR
eukprot:scaffold16545_cov121-Isochrysis_galbana.AAC.3